MKKTLLILLIAILMPATSHAGSLTEKEAKDIAGKLLGDTLLTVVREHASYCIVQRKEGTGYVIIAKERDVLRRILGFSKESAWEEDKIPQTLLCWLDELDKTCTITNVHKEKRITEHATFNAKSSIAPLLTCHWHQNSPYNDLAPVIEDGNVKTVAGCVAIAAAQITYYWRRDNLDATLKNTPTYIYGGAPVTEVIPAGSPNNWQLMLDQYDSSSSPESRAAAAQLCYVLGTSSYLNYASSTGGSIRDAASAMYSQYRLLSNYVTKSKFTQEEWDSLLYSDLQKGYPVMCSGQGSGGHAFVLDGYSQELDLYHFNFGWGGSGDGYYPIDDTEEAMGGYYRGQAVAYDIHPKTRNIQTEITTKTIVIESGLAKVSLGITNNSTLPIRKLYLFPTGSEEPSSTTSALSAWDEEPIINDGVKKDIEIQFSIDNTDQQLGITVTDENLYVLTKVILDIKTGITEVTSKSGHFPTAVYDMTGRQVSNSSKAGVYLVKRGNKTTKIAIH